jgi:hypothetical protein
MTTSLSPTLTAELRDKATEFGLSAVHDELAANATECLALIADGDDDYSQLGNTRFGGQPDLPEGVPWPATGEPDDDETVFSNFICQINLAEMPRIPTAASLPASGMFYLFVRSLDSAYMPVVYDAIYHAGGPEGLSLRQQPDDDRMADEYLLDLSPVRARAESAVSIAWYRKALRKSVESHGGHDAMMAFYKMDEALARQDQIAQMFGFANAGDERVDLYRKMYFTRIGKTDLHYNDYWASLEAYEAELAFRRERRETSLVEMYEKMRPGVMWILENEASIAAAVAEWRLLLRVDSNHHMQMSILDADPIYVFARDVDLLASKFDDLPGQVTQG